MGIVQLAARGRVRGLGAGCRRIDRRTEALPARLSHHGLRTAPKRSSKASRSSTATAWAKRLAATAKQLRKPTLPSSTGLDVPALHELDLSIPLAVFAQGAIARVQAQRHRLVAGRHGPIADRVRRLTLVVRQMLSWAGCRFRHVDRRNDAPTLMG